MSTLQTRAVERVVVPGTTGICPRCDLSVKYEAKKHNRQVICNVYEDGKWNRIEHYHDKCYEKAKMPYGEPQPEVRDKG